MLQTTIIFEGNIAADLDVAFTPSGKQLVRFAVLVNRRRRNPDTSEWEDDEPTRHACTAFGSLGENIADSLSKGDRVLIVGSVVTDAWNDKDTAQRVLVDAAGPSLRWATARVHKAQRTSSDTDSDQTD